MAEWKQKYNKNVLGSDSPSTRISNNMRVAQLVNIYKGGKTQFGNFYLTFTMESLKRIALLKNFE